MDDAHHMRRAIALARRGEGFTSPNPLVGCVLVKDGEVIAEGYHPRPGEEHAEAMALRLAGPRARGATAYVTLEPCNHHGRTPPCADALIRAGIVRVVYGAPDPNPLAEGGARSLRAAGIAAERGPCSHACAELIRPWAFSLSSDRPWVVAKLAVSLDGMSATRTGESKWITGPQARARGHDLRQRTGAILVGIGTVMADDPGLDPRPEGLTPAPSLKVVFDSQLRTPATARFLTTPGPALVIGHETAPESRADKLLAAGAEVLRFPGNRQQPDLGAALHSIRTRGINEVMIEGGPALLGTAFDQGLIDEVWAFIAPLLIGGGQNGIRSDGPAALGDALRLTDVTTESLGPDLLVRGITKRG